MKIYYDLFHIIEKDRFIVGGEGGSRSRAMTRRAEATWRVQASRDGGGGDRGRGSGQRGPT